MGTVRTSVANSRILACAACLWGGSWFTACGSTKSDVNNDTSGTSSSDATSTTDGTQTTTGTGSGGATSSSTTTGNASGTDAGGGSGGSNLSTASGGSAGTTGTAAGGSGGSGSSAGGATNSGGSSGSSGSGGSTATNGGSAGSGGTSSDCSGAIPFGGPREDGPEAIHQSCSLIEDDVILDRYDDTDAKVPRGLYYEQPGTVSWWDEPCSDSLDETVDRIGDHAIGEIQSQVATDWSYTVAGCMNGAHRFYNNLRCDYFDGTTLDGSSAEDLAFLASLLWWMERGNLGGAQILGYTASIGGATDTVVMCTLRTTFGDFGLCDQITLEETQYTITVNGRVTIRDTETVRTIEGNCN